MNPWLALYQCSFPAVGAAVAAAMLLGGRGRTLREGAADLRQRLGRLTDEEAAAAGPGGLWLHAASVGELSGAAALLKALGPGRRAFVTTSTVAGREGARLLPGVRAACLAPMDLLPIVGRFLDRIRPKALAVLETELWPATLAACAARGVPFAVANARITERSFPRYRLVKPLFEPSLRAAAAIAAQTPRDAERFAALGAPEDRIRVTGNMKYDASEADPAAVREAGELLRSVGWAPGTDPVWCAGSTRPGAEEAAILGAFRTLKAKVPGLRLILAPRHVERAGEAAAELSRLGIAFTRASEPKGPADCLLVDVLGRLKAFYAASDAAFVGGTLVPVGGHNLLEPAAAGVPVFFGPHTAAIQGPAAALERGGGFRVRDEAGLARGLEALLTSPALRSEASHAAKAAAAEFAGAAARTAAFLAERLGL